VIAVLLESLAELDQQPVDFAAHGAGVDLAARRAQREEADAQRELRVLVALARVAAARGCMQHGRVGEKGPLISRALAIVDELRSSLDIERGGTIAANLDDLYDYMSRRLVEANATDRLELLDEVTTLLRELRDAWVAVSADAPQPG